MSLGPGGALFARRPASSLWSGLTVCQARLRNASPKPRSGGTTVWSTTSVMIQWLDLRVSPQGKWPFSTTIRPRGTCLARLRSAITVTSWAVRRPSSGQGMHTTQRHVRLGPATAHGAIQRLNQPAPGFEGRRPLLECLLKPPKRFIDMIETQITDCRETAASGSRLGRA
jgi:hypothetical protein